MDAPCVAQVSAWLAELIRQHARPTLRGGCGGVCTQIAHGSGHGFFYVNHRATHGALPHRAPSTRCTALIWCTMCGTGQPGALGHDELHECRPGPHMLLCHTVRLPLGALLIPCTVCGTGVDITDALADASPSAEVAARSVDSWVFQCELGIFHSFAPGPHTQCTPHTVHLPSASLGANADSMHRVSVAQVHAAHAEGRARAAIRCDAFPRHQAAEPGPRRV